MKINSLEKYNEPNFGKFIKISGQKKDLKQFRSQLYSSSCDKISFIKNKSKQKAYLYVISGKDLEKFLDLMEKVPFFSDLRANTEKFLNKKPKKLGLKEAKLKLKENNLI